MNLDKLVAADPETTQESAEDVWGEHIKKEVDPEEIFTPGFLQPAPIKPAPEPNIFEGVGDEGIHDAFVNNADLYLPPQSERLGLTTMEQAERFFKRQIEDTQRVPIGIDWIDELTYGGVAKGQVCSILGQSGAGKTSLLDNILSLNRNIPALDCSFEMDAEDRNRRSMALWKNSPLSNVNKAYYTKSIPKSLINEWAEEHKLHYRVEVAQSIDGMFAAIEEYKRIYGFPPLLVSIDYLGIVDPTEKQSKAFDQPRAIAAGIKELAKQANVAIVLLCQANKEVPDGVLPYTGSFAYAGLAQSDIAIGMANPQNYREKASKVQDPMTTEWLKGFFDINLLKNRNGENLPYGRRHVVNAARKIDPRFATGSTAGQFHIPDSSSN